MKFIEKIDECIKNGTNVFVNGMPDEVSEKGSSKILKREDDFIVFEIIDFETNKKEETKTTDTINIPIAKIDTISEVKTSTKKDELGEI